MDTDFNTKMKKLSVKGTPKPRFAFMDLPDHIKVEILRFCKVKIMLNVTETCKELNKLVFSENKLANRVAIKNHSRIKNAQLLSEILEESDRNYRNLSIINCESANRDFEKAFPDDSTERLNLNLTWMNIFQVRGSYLREFTTNLKVLEIADLLMYCENLEELRIGQPGDKTLYVAERVDRRVHLPKLRVLVISHVTQNFIKHFSNVRSLEKLELNFRSELFWNEEDVSGLEDFFLQQHNLKSLICPGRLPREMFPKSRLAEVKFKLEYLDLNKFSSLHSPNLFFQTQSDSLKNVCNHSLGLEDLLILPKLEQAYILGKVDWNIMIDQGIQRPSMTSVEIFYPHFSSDEFMQMFKIYPKIEKVFIFLDIAVTPTPIDEQLTVPSELVKFIHFFSFRQDRLFNYQPTEPSIDLEKDATNILKFFKNNMYYKKIQITIKKSGNLDQQWPDTFEKHARLYLGNLESYNVTII